MAPAAPPPHLTRLLQLLRSLPGPLVQVWGWPGTGKRGVLEGLAGAEGEGAVWVSAAELAAPEPWPERVRWILCADPGAADLGPAAAALGPGRRLAVAARRRRPAQSSVLGPEELLLGEAEVAALVGRAGAAAGGDVVRLLHAATDGWLEPLRLILDGGTPETPSAEFLADLPAVASFLRREVFAPLPAGLRRLLLEVAAGGEVDAQVWQQVWDEEDGCRAALASLVEEEGLVVAEGGARRLPRLLRAFLLAEGRRSIPAAELFAARERLALAAWGLGRPAMALAALAAAGDGVRAGRLLAAEGGELAAAPADLAAAGPPSDRRAPSAGPPVYRIRLFGVPEVVREREGAGEAVRWTLRRALAIFALVASARGRRASRETIVEAVWPEEREAVVRRNFHPTLSHLRRSLAGDEGGPAPLLFDRGVYRLNPALDWRIDCDEFQRLAAAGAARRTAGDAPGAVAAWRDAWRLHRGAFLEGHDAPWIVDRREALNRTLLEMLRELGEVLFEAGDLPAALDAFRSVLVVDPLQERVHVAVMRVFAAQARRDLVRRQYDRLGDLLREELGVEPLAESTEEFHRLMG
jgi:DNA-binding SARP family transcriptional activator